MIPPITDPLGRHWSQPDPAGFLLDDTHAVMTQRQFDSLADYSRSMPTGVYPGKCWKAVMSDGRSYLRWYGIVEGRDDLCSNNQREILIVAVARKEPDR
ncbi:hypothetical protein JT27_15005 [Alcaligenes faecalis]|nr:hypothetical protein JT27_15005 [Alcaligenes faecalis]